jgi:hypothetical protein
VYSLLILLRLSHIVLGVLWVGMMGFSVIFLTPALREAGPPAQSVMAALERRRVMMVMPLLALGTIISGILLMHRLYGDMSMLASTRMGLALIVGGVASLIAFILGVAVMRPSMTRAATLAQSLASAATENQRAELGARIQTLRARGSVVGQLVLGLLLLASGAMAVARYL